MKIEGSITRVTHALDDSYGKDSGIKFAECYIDLCEHADHFEARTWKRETTIVVKMGHSISVKNFLSVDLKNQWKSVNKRKAEILWEYKADKDN